jgi:4-carboxymuconolactone decarboxylase
MTPAQQEGHRLLSKVEGDSKPELPGPLKIWADNPYFASAIALFAAYFRSPRHSLSEREHEITICAVTRKWRATLSADAHGRLLIDLGVSLDMTQALACGDPTSFQNQREQVIYEMTNALADKHWIPRSLYDRAVEVLGHDGVTDAITHATVLMGFYTSITLTLNLCLS